ncbi:TPA: hypothetical protein ACF37J_005079, partial [Escherichia coli]
MDKHGVTRLPGPKINSETKNMKSFLKTTIATSLLAICCAAPAFANGVHATGNEGVNDATGGGWYHQGGLDDNPVPFASVT